MKEPDTTRVGRAPPPGAAGARRAAAPGAPPTRVDTTPARVDTSEVKRLLAQRPVPFDKVLVRFARPLAPETRYLFLVHGAVNLNSATGDGKLGLLTPKRPAPSKADTTHAPRPAPRPPER